MIAFIHGGRFEEGHGDDGWFDGGALAAVGCVVVTLNYRLRFGGFLPLDPVNDPGSPGRSRGVADLIHALQWIRDAVPGVGGDPDNVTLIGQSAGGGLVTALLADRQADALFHRAVLLSPGLPRFLLRTGWRIRRLIARALLGVPLTGKALTALPGQRVERAYRRMARLYFSDCAVGPGPVDLSQMRGVPLLVSTMHDEFVGFPGVTVLDRVRARLRLPAAVFSPGMLLLGVPLRHLRHWWRYAETDRPLGRTVGDTMIRRWAAAVLEYAPGDRVWACEFRGGRWRGDCVDARHCGDLPLLFDTTGVDPDLVRAFCGPDTPERTVAVGRRFRAAVVRFARVGDPGWDPYPGSRTTRVFDLVGGPDRDVTDPLSAVRTLLASDL